VSVAVVAAVFLWLLPQIADFTEVWAAIVDMSWLEALAAFALVRLVTALPITPGGLGLVELGLVAALVLAGGARAPVVAAVLVFRFLTLIVQVPIGGIAYLGWRARMRRVKEVPADAQPLTV
jgi:putative heme transporter